MSFTIKDLQISSLDIILGKPLGTYLGMTRVGDLSREAILASLRECDLSVLKDEVNKNLFNDKKFCKECITVTVKYTQKLEIVEEMIDFLYAASEETR